MEVFKDPASRLIYSFGPFQLDPAERRLLCEGRDLRLSPKVFDTLVILVERHGLLVEKDDLMKTVWPGMFVEEVTLARNISLLRKALGDVPGQDESQYIETVSKRGYRFIAHVKKISKFAVSSDDSQDVGTESSSLGTRSKWWQNRRSLTALPGLALLRARITWAIAGVLLGVLAATGIVYLVIPVQQPTVTRSRILPPVDTQFNAFDNEHWLPAISPDGTHIVFPVWDSRGASLLWLRDMDDIGEGRALPGTEGGGFPFWSPDGRSIGFFADGKLKRIDIKGNLVQILCTATRARGGAWNQDGIILFETSQFSEISQIPATGGAVIPVTELDAARGETSHRWPVFLADGRHFLFFIRSEEHPEIAGIYAGSLDSKNYHLVVKATMGPVFEARETITYVRDGVVLAQRFDERKLTTAGEPVVLPDHVAFNPVNSTALFSVSPAGVMVYYPPPPGGPFTLTWFDREGKRGNSVDSAFFYGLSLSPDGTKAAVSILDADGLSSDLWSLDLNRGTKTRLTSGPQFKTVPVWDPSGQSILFNSGFTGPGKNQIDRIKSDGTAPSDTVLKKKGVTDFPGAFCRDGRYLAYTESGTSSRIGTIWILPFSGERKPFTLLQSQFENGEPRFSPDCNWVSYSSNETGQSEVYVTHFPDAARRYRVSTEGGGDSRWSEDGKELFYFSSKQNSLVAVSVREKADSITLGMPRTLFRISNYGSVFTYYAVAGNGMRFLIAEANPTKGITPLTLVTNWDAGLKELKR